VTDDLLSEPEQSPDSSLASNDHVSTKRARLSAWLVALATVLMVVGIFSTWVKVQALDTDSWVELSDDLLQEPRVQESLSAYIVDQLYEQLDVSAEIEEGLPENFEGLAGPLTAALRGPATMAVEVLVGSEQFRTAWLGANRIAHEAAVNILRDDTRAGISTADGVVTLEIQELVEIVGQKLGLSDSLLDGLPEDAGRITILESEELADAQAAVRVLDFLAWFVFVIVVALYAAAVYLAEGRRLRVLRNVGFSLIGAGLVVLMIRGIAIRILLDSIVENPAQRPLADVTAHVATGLVGQIASAAIVYGLLFVGFAMLLGDHRWARSTRKVIAPIFSASDGVIVAATAGLLLLVVWWSPGRAFDQLVTALTLIGLIIIAVIALRRAVNSEFPSEAIEERLT